MEGEIPTLDDIRKAQEYLKGKINRTPLFYSSTMSKTYSGNIHFKMENLQKTGSFKTRGAMYRISNLTEEEKKRGVTTASAGNHAQGLAYSAMVNGIDAKIVMPEFATPAKANAVLGYGAKVILHGSDYAEAREKADEIAQNENRVFIEAFNDPAIISGQATIGLEILEDLPDVDTIVVPVGGGGLIAGVALGAKYLKKDVRIIGVQSELSDSMRLSMLEGKLVPKVSYDSIADGITVKYPGELNLKVAMKYVDEVVTVTEEGIAKALFKLLERNKTLVEPSGAAGFAAIMEGKVNVAGKNVAVILSGGNINFLLLSKIIFKSLENNSELVRIMCKIPDKPGTLQKISAAISGTGANIFHAEVDNLIQDTPIGFQSIMFTLSLRGQDHLSELLGKLREIGYKFDVLTSSDF
ncbi:threonine dehydratase [uncultured archaeon]|nr:threonine dehydratase [uncultured archaeon]